MTQTRQLEFQLTPLGAAIVEAFPDQKKARSIKRAFSKLRVCPASEMFDRDAVEAFYRQRGHKILCDD